MMPRIVYVNKMDRIGSSYGKCLEELGRKLSLLSPRPGYLSPPTLVDNADPAHGLSVGTHRTFLPIQWPVVSAKGMGMAGNGFLGIVDLVGWQVMTWPSKDGSVVDRKPMESAEALVMLPAEEREAVYQRCVQAREELVDSLASLDDLFVEAFLAPGVDGDPSKLTVSAIMDSLRRLVRSGRGVPVLCGSSARNTGVQPVLDAVCQLLPGPVSDPSSTPTKPKQQPPSKDSSKLTALAFKVIHSPPHGGPLTFLRIYSGHLPPRAAVYNYTRRLIERPTKLMQAYADDYEEVPELGEGKIGVLVGMKATGTGDVLVLPVPHGTNPHAGSGKKHKKKNNQVEEVKPQGLPMIPIPPPVFFTSVTPAIGTSNDSLMSALSIMSKEDPSLRYRVDEESGQLLVMGMGELHLEIVGNRLGKEFGAKVVYEKVRVAYRERLDDEVERGTVRKVMEWDREVFGKRQKVGVVVEITPILDEEEEEDGLDGMEGIEGGDGKVVPDSKTKAAGSAPADAGSATTTTPEDPDNPFSSPTPDEDNNIVLIPTWPFTTDGGVPPPPADMTDWDPQLPPTYPDIAEYLGALQSGVQQALLRGPLIAAPLRSVKVRVVSASLYNPEWSTPSALRVATRQAVAEAVKEIGTHILEPVAVVSVTCPGDGVGAVTRDLTSPAGRRGRILGMAQAGEDDTMITAKCPVATMGTYSNVLRGLTAGKGRFGMRVTGFERVMGGEMKEQEIIKEVRGY